MWGRFDSRYRTSHSHRPGGLSQISIYIWEAGESEAEAGLTECGTWAGHQSGCLTTGTQSGTQVSELSRRGGLGLQGRKVDPEIGMISDS